jgi:choline dehydrogenase
MRGTPGDYDDWRQRGCEGWDWDNVLPFFKKAQNQQRGASDLHGTGGPLHVSDIPHQWPLAKAMLEAALQAGIPRNDDFNGAQQEGAGYYQFTVNKRRRWSSARAYLGPARGRANLIVVTEAHATRVLFEGMRAVGVEYRTPAGLTCARAGRELIVSGGAFGSPQLLQLSGIGPAEHLHEMNIAVVRDIKAVGANLQDHFNTYLSYRCPQPITLNDLAGSATRRLLAGAQYALTRSGPLTGTGIYAGAFVRSDRRLERPDLQINMSAWSTAERKRTGIVPHPFPAFTLSPVHLRPEGRGTVRLKGPDPQMPPAIRFNQLRTDYDVSAILYGMRLCRQIAGQAALRPFVVEEVMPGPKVADDAELLADVRERGVANFHPVGTCRMGHGPDAVVDPRLRVHGVKGLRVADASIMPTIVAGNTNAPSIMIGEKCAAMILEDAMAA